MLEPDLIVFLRLAVVTVLAGVLGWEREATGKAAGIRTHILVGISAVLFIEIGELFVLKFRTFGETMRFDPLRIIEAIVTGITFLGAGMIVFRRGRGTVKGLTTAAGILTTAAIGMIVGLDRYVLAIGTTLLVFFVLHFLNKIEVKYFPEPGDE